MCIKQVFSNKSYVILTLNKYIQVGIYILHNFYTGNYAFISNGYQNIQIVYQI